MTHDERSEVTGYIHRYRIPMALSPNALLFAHRDMLSKHGPLPRLYVFVPAHRASIAKVTVATAGLNLPVIGLRDTDLTEDGWVLASSLPLVDEAIRTGHANAF